MLFNSLQYLIFLPIVVALYYALPPRVRPYMLLVASYYFYMCWKAEYIVLIAFSTLTTFAAGLCIVKTPSTTWRKQILAGTLVVNFGILFAFKYANFVSSSVTGLLDEISITARLPMLDLLLPVGISFYTFQSLSYAIDVYRGDKKPERNILIFALYVSFFPQLVAGPIERSTRLLPQLIERFNFDYARTVEGLQLILWGFFKKVVIADRLALIVNPVFDMPSRYGAGALLGATYAFSYQIYCDFSGYSDIAIGSALIFGIRLIDNFDRPYSATSIPEFWRRWHISLTTWFRDYLYIPLGGNRVSHARLLINIALVFLISGLWHGAAWTFVIWGALHGSLLIASRESLGLRKRIYKSLGLFHIPCIHKGVKIIITFHLVAIAWIFFRAANVSDAFLILERIFSALASSDQTMLANVLGIDSLPVQEFIIAGIAITILEIVQLRQRERSISAYFAVMSRPLRWALALALVWIIVVFGKYGDASQEFVYFQF
jgi:D-alanyl-lipoteichoic acid acyltransferase DltB (MBOAT superfamily)